MAIKQLSDGNPDGTTVGQAAADKISFHGATPIVQQVVAADANVAAVVTALTALGLIRNT